MSLYARLGKAVYYLAWPGLFIYLRIGSRTRVAVVAEGHILLVKGWMDDARWGLPGGGLHRHEDMVAGATREVAEETGVTILDTNCTYLISEWRGKHGLKFYCHFLSVHLQSMPRPRPQPGEIIAVGWFPLEQIPSLSRKKEVDRALELLGTA